MMPSVFDVARYILRKRGSMSTWKLQKLVYYSQAWHLVWDDERLFGEPIEAWPAGPVSPVLYRVLKGKFAIGPSAFKHGRLRNLCASQRTSIDAVLDFYAERESHWLTELIRSEAPWVKARAGLHSNERGRKRISVRAMRSYYSALVADDDGATEDEDGGR